MDFTNKRINEC